MPTCMSDLSGELPAHGRKGRWKGAWAGVAVHAGQAEGSVRFSHRNAALSAGRWSGLFGGVLANPAAASTSSKWLQDWPRSAKDCGSRDAGVRPCALSHSTL